MDKGEFELIGSIKERFETPQGVVGIGDDCAVLRQHDGVETVVTTDMLVEDVHFRRKSSTPFDVGWKSVAVNLSDIAAMGASPAGTFLSVALPPSVGEEWLSAFLDGYQYLSDRYGAPLLGGDTNASPRKICISVTALGECPAGGSLKRSGAVPGDIIYVSGYLGDAAAGYRIIENGLGGGYFEDIEEGRLQRPEPQLELGLKLRSLPGVHAMMDISDGLASDIRHIMESSGVGAEIDTAALPFTPMFKSVCSKYGWDPFELALCGGEDYQLLFAAAPDCEVPRGECTPVGRIVEGGALRWLGREGEDFMGYRHFSGDSI